MLLSEELMKWRADLPDEWKMDEFIRKAELLELCLIPEGYALVKVSLDREELVIESWSSKQSGGWNLGVAKGVKITHIPTGFVVYEDSERSQHKNRLLALGKLKAMLAAAQENE